VAFLFCLAFAVLLGYFFAWIYNYRNLHIEPKETPKKITETVDFPVEIIAKENQESSALKRLEQERTCYETDSANKDIFVKKLLALFRSRIEKENNDILSICYWKFGEEGFTLKISNSPYRIAENLFVPKSSRYFSKKEFNWNGIDEIPIDVFHSEEQITCSMAGAVISGDGKLRGYVTIDSSIPRAFDDGICRELREIATLIEEVFRILDSNYKLDKESKRLNRMLEDISVLFMSSSKGNLIANLFKILQDNFIFDRLLLLTRESQGKWYIPEAAGKQKENFKGVFFDIHEKCLLYELLAGQVSIVNEKKILSDPYQRRLYENEPENLELHSLCAVTPPAKNNSYPIAIVLESINNTAVSKTDENILSCIVACASMKLSNIKNKTDSQQKREEDLEGIDSNGLGELLKYYETEIANLKNTEDGLGILFIKCQPKRKENMAADFEKFSTTLKKLKKAWNVRHLAKLGNGEFVLSRRGNFDENLFSITADTIITDMENIFFEDSLQIKNHKTWLSRNKIAEKEKTHKQTGITLFTITVMKEFKKMSDEAGD
jgi:hypothetical protein